MGNFGKIGGNAEGKKIFFFLEGHWRKSFPFVGGLIPFEKFSFANDLKRNGDMFEDRGRVFSSPQ